MDSFQWNDMSNKFHINVGVKPFFCIFAPTIVIFARIKYLIIS